MKLCASVQPSSIMSPESKCRMVGSIRAAALVLLFCTCHAVALAQSVPTEARWSELSQIIEGYQVQLVLPDGVAIKGEAATVRADTLIINIKRTTNGNAHPKGRSSIPRASVTLIEVERREGRRGRNLGATVGVIAGVALGAYAAAGSTDSGGNAVVAFAAIGSAGALGGYFLGRTLDTRKTSIKIVP